MLASSSGLLPINVRLQGANALMNDIPPSGSSTSPSSLAADEEQLTRTVHYNYGGKSITFEVVNKRMSLTALDSRIEEVDQIPDNAFKRILTAIFCSCISFKMRRAKAKSSSTTSNA